MVVVGFVFRNEVVVFRHNVRRLDFRHLFAELILECFENVAREFGQVIISETVVQVFFRRIPDLRGRKVISQSSVRVFLFVAFIFIENGNKDIRLQFVHGYGRFVFRIGGQRIPRRNGSVSDFLRHLFFLFVVRLGGRGLCAVQRVVVCLRLERFHVVTAVVVFRHFRRHSAAEADHCGLFRNVLIRHGALFRFQCKRGRFDGHFDVLRIFFSFFYQFDFGIDLRVVEIFGIAVVVVDDDRFIQTVYVFSVLVLIRYGNIRYEVALVVQSGDLVVRSALFFISFRFFRFFEISFQPILELLVDFFHDGISFRYREDAFGREGLTVRRLIFVRQAIQCVVSSRRLGRFEKFAHRTDGVVLLRLQRFNGGFHHVFRVVIVRKSVLGIQLAVIADCIVDRIDDFPTGNVEGNDVIPVVPEHFDVVAELFGKVNGHRCDHTACLSFFVGLYKRARRKQRREDEDQTDHEK